MKTFGYLLGLFVLVLSVRPALAQEGRATVGGYGELHYNDVTNTETGANPAGQLDFHRFILFVGYAFNDWVSFHSELELEHTLIEAGEEKGGEVALEQAYVDLKYHPAIGVRAGLMLVPVGIINPVHEPPTFNGVERPNVEKVLIPTTWRESGVGIYGRLAEGLGYEAYVMAGLSAAGISGKDGIRGARQSGFRSSTDNLAFTARLSYQVNLNLSVAASYYGSALSADETVADADLDGVAFHLLEAHAQYRKGALEARGLLLYSTVSEVEKLNAVFGKEVGSSQFGGYLELGYDVLGLIVPDTEQQVTVFGRYELYDTQASTEGFAANEAYARRETTLGLTYRPMPQVALKVDHQWLYNKESHNFRQFNLGVGYNF